MQVIEQLKNKNEQFNKNIKDKAKEIEELNKEKKELYDEIENIKKSNEEQQKKQNLLNESQKGDLQKSIDLMKNQFDSEKQAFLNDIKKRNEEIANALNLNMQLKEALQN